MKPITVHRILHHSTPNINGRIYPKEVMEDMVNRWNEKKASGNATFVYLGTEQTLDKAAGVVDDMWVDDEGLVIANIVMNTKSGDAILEMFEKGNARVSPVSYGTVVNNTVTDFNLMYVSVEPTK